MHITLLSDPAVPGADEDAAGTLGQVAVLLDGAGVPARFRAGCHHSVAWFSHTLAAHLLAHAQDPSVSLADALAEAIAAVRALHENECDLDRGGPSATVLALRWDAEHLEHLVLCDSSVLLVGGHGEVRRLTDSRVEAVVREEGEALAIEARRNAPGGFWVARHEPEAAAQALTGRVPLSALTSVHLVSDGITRAVDMLGLHEETSLARALSSDPRALVRQLRAAERAMPPGQRPRKVHDDATVLTISPELSGQGFANSGDTWERRALGDTAQGPS